MVDPQRQSQIAQMLHAAAPQQSYDGLHSGNLVRMSGLGSRPELNGQTAVCCEYIPQKERWHVRLSSGEEISLKPRFLALVD